MGVSENRAASKATSEQKQAANQGPKQPAQAN
jgi:hypothetical protein